jgi:hypothetical protein
MEQVARFQHRLRIDAAGIFQVLEFPYADSAEFLSSIGFHVAYNEARIILPVAISFYTFQALSYTIDVYRGRPHATKSFADYRSPPRKSPTRHKAQGSTAQAKPDTFAEPFVAGGPQYA